MIEIELDLTKSIEENAGHYFDLSKKAKKKLAGAQKAIDESKRKLEKLRQEESLFQEEEQQKMQKIELRRQKESHRQWYEKFHWFISSEEFLCIGGKDATSNEIIIKKHLEKDDVVFHTDMPGSPFFIVKNGQNAGKATLEEAAQATAVYSRAWKLGHTAAEVFYVRPEQVTKEARPGEYLTKGSFMVYGKKNYLHPHLEYAMGIIDGQIIAGPENAVKPKTKNYLIVVHGRNQKSDLAKKIKHKLGGGELDDIIQFLPAGGGELKK